MAFWIYGRDAESGEPADPFFSEADTEEKARLEAEEQGLLIDSIEHVDPTDKDTAPIRQWSPPDSSPVGARQRTASSNSATLWWAILATALCCLPVGIVAIVHAVSAGSEQHRGDHQQAKYHAEQANRWTLGAALLGLLVIAAFVIYRSL